MDAQIEQQVRERAYQIWIEAGMADGSECEHWVAAERDIAATFGTKPKLSKRATASKSKAVVSKASAGEKPVAKSTRVQSALPDAKAGASKVKPKKSAMSTVSEIRSSLN